MPIRQTDTWDTTASKNLTLSVCQRELITCVPGLYLFLQVQIPLSLAMVRHLHFLVIGWGQYTARIMKANFFICKTIIIIMLTFDFNSDLRDYYHY